MFSPHYLLLTRLQVNLVLPVGETSLNISHLIMDFVALLMEEMSKDGLRELLGEDSVIEGYDFE